MKKTFLFAIALGSLATAAQAQKAAVKKPVPVKAVAAPVLKNAIDSFSYAAGLNIAGSMKQQGLTDINSAMVQRAMEDVFKNRKALLTEEQAGMTLQEKLQEFAQKKAAAEKAKGTAYQANNKKKAGVTVLPNGLQYEILKAGEPTGQKPAATDTVVVHYSGTLIDGTKFDASYDRGEPATFPLNGVIRGWTEILQLMTKGAKWKVVIPSDMGYGERGYGGAIGPNQTLVFDIELLDIKPAVVQ
ncbi:MAG: FKBP-type peptidyl-prolyl cis-trans isomerase [Chitinophagaceae bacterium]|nr:MAG: FKBP-type peptidyl-prolyl cis-trans isomerase [Chitinophagaceae bacterium]